MILILQHYVIEFEVHSSYCVIVKIAPNIKM